MPPRHRTAMILTIGLCAVAIPYWTKGFRYLIDGPGGQGAIDLRLRWVEQRYVLNRQNPYDVDFAGEQSVKPAAVWNGRNASVLSEVGPPASVDYPPWSYFSGYLFFWPSWRSTRIYYAGIQLLCLVWLIRWAFLQGRSVDVSCAAFCAAGMAATASFCTTLANGQYGILVLALLAASMHLDEIGWPYAAGMLAGVACLKPRLCLKTVI